MLFKSPAQTPSQARQGFSAACFAWPPIGTPGRWGGQKLCFESMVDQRGQVQRKLVKTRYLSLQLVILLLESCDELLVSRAPTHLVIGRHEVFGLELKDVIKKWTTSMFRKRLSCLILPLSSCTTIRHLASRAPNNLGSLSPLLKYLKVCRIPVVSL